MGYIYKITNKVNGKAYIGQTKNPVETRWYHHIYTAIKENEEDNRQYLHRSIAKYGVENFTFEVIEEINDSLLDEREIYWIAFYHTYRYDEAGNQSYNLTRGGKGNRKFETETLIQAFYDNNEHLGNTCKDIGCSEPTLIKALKIKGLHGKGAFTPVYQISLKDGSIIRRFESYSDVEKEFNLGRTTVWSALNGQQKTAAGYAWCRVEDYPNFKLEDHIDKKKRQIKCVEENLIFNSVREAAEWVAEREGDNDYKGRTANICTSCKRPNRKAYGYKWVYIDTQE